MKEAEGAKMKGQTDVQGAITPGVVMSFVKKSRCQLSILSRAVTTASFSAETCLGATGLHLSDQTFRLCHLCLLQGCARQSHQLRPGLLVIYTHLSVCLVRGSFPGPGPSQSDCSFVTVHGIRRDRKFIDAVQHMTLNPPPSLA